MNHYVPRRKAVRRFDLMFRRTVSSLTLRLGATWGTVNSSGMFMAQSYKATVRCCSIHSTTMGTPPPAPASPPSPCGCQREARRRCRGLSAYARRRTSPVPIPIAAVGRRSPPVPRSPKAQRATLTQWSSGALDGLQRSRCIRLSRCQLAQHVGFVRLRLLRWQPPAQGRLDSRHELPSARRA